MKQAAILILVMLALTACATSISSKPIGEGGLFGGQTELDPCAEVSCGKNALCDAGACMCAPKYEDCDAANPGNNCVSPGGCCSDADCTENEICNTAAECEYSCDKVECDVNKVCYPKQEGCFCPDGTKWCDLQNLCIPLDNCCGKFDCGREQVCSKTIESGKICLIGEQKICKFLGGVAKDFGIDGKTFTIGAKKFHYNEYVLLQVNDEEYQMSAGENITIDGIIIQLDLLKTTGGQCKARNRDGDN